ncbi:RND family efflux transporter, MFP subunit [Loktanella fryxellensis]|uniref:RND family efflux transporter, MFP subunit n=1 Tax=Loktanella fryxellensis TaxID=245187 RepID=A0A1H8AU62_9RHOB|nr:efflux RND transporter periplasmic adaptor subunit [Loktanella fryxellensis]SEM73504.1 RND family efflux transporter, MFP subunit [Loktanella fryxellensis]
MSIFKQCLLGIGILAAAFVAWIQLVPTARTTLDGMGLGRLAAMAPDPAANATPDAAPGGGRPGGGSATVVAMPVTMGAIDNSVMALGDAQAIRSVTVRSEAAGLIQTLSVTDGSRVSAGDVLVSLDDAAQQIALQQAQATLNDAQAELDRQTQLRQSGAAAAVTLQAAELELQTAALAVEQAEYNLEQRTITSPISGRMGLLEVEAGARIAAQDPIGVITDQSEILIDFRVPERAVGQMTVGAPITVMPLAVTDVTIAGEIRAVDNIVDLASRTLRVQGVVPNDDNLLRAGMSATVTVAFDGDEFPTIDPLALQWSNEGSYVWVAVDGQAKRVPVVIRERNADSILVEGDLADGDLVITEGLATLQDGDAVVLAPNDDAQASVAPAPSL